MWPVPVLCRLWRQWPPLGADKCPEEEMEQSCEGMKTGWTSNANCANLSSLAQLNAYISGTQSSRTPGKYNFNRIPDIRKSAVLFSSPGRKNIHTILNFSSKY